MPLMTMMVILVPPSLLPWEWKIVPAAPQIPNNELWYELATVWSCDIGKVFSTYCSLYPMDIILSIVFYFSPTHCMLSLGYVAASCECFVFATGPYYPLHCVLYHPCFVRKCAKYRRINTAPSVGNITTVHKFTSPWEPVRYVCGWCRG